MFESIENIWIRLFIGLCIIVLISMLWVKLVFAVAHWGDRRRIKKEFGKKHKEMKGLKELDEDFRPTRGAHMRYGGGGREE